MIQPTTEQRLNNLESGIIAAANNLHEIISDPEIDEAMKQIRIRINNLNRKLEIFKQTVKTAHSIILGTKEIENV